MSDSDNAERRMHPRVSLEDDHSTSIFAEAATPIDLSTTGVLLEVSSPLRGVVARLRLDLGPDREFHVEGRVVRHFVNRFELNEEGTTIVKYRVAIEFLDLDEGASQIIQSYIDLPEEKELREEFGVGIDLESSDRRSEDWIEPSDVQMGQVMFLADFRLLRLSVGGMLVGLTFPLPVGSIHPFAFTVDGHHIDAQGEVLHCDPSDGEESSLAHRAAICFLGLSDADQNLLRQHVQQTLECDVVEVQEPVEVHRD